MMPEIVHDCGGDTTTSYGSISSSGFGSKRRDDVSYNQLQKFWGELSIQARQELLRIDKQNLFEQARKNMYCSRCNGLLLEGFMQIIMYGKSLQNEGTVTQSSGYQVGNAKSQTVEKTCLTIDWNDDIQDPSVHPWGGLTTTRDGTLTLLDCYIYAKYLKGLQNVFDSARARERERELLYPDACGGGGRGWISQGIMGYGRGHGTRETCALHNARLSVDTLVDFWSVLGEDTRYSLLRMKEEDFMDRLLYRFDNKRFCRDCRKNVVREFKELKELKRLRKETRCTSWFCVADTSFQYEVTLDTVYADWHQTYADSTGIYKHYEWAVGTGEGTSDILEFGNVGSKTRVEMNGLDLTGLNSCYITLRAWRTDGRCNEISVKAHALKGQNCVHGRLTVGDGFVTITRGESIRRFFEHAEEAEEEEDDDSMDKDGNDLDGECFCPQKHAKSPELAREFLLDAATVIFKEHVEKAFREGTARQNAHSMFVSLALKLLEERVMVACKDFITLEMQVYRLHEILFATNNFSDENLIMEGGAGKVYKGQLNKGLRMCNIAVRRLDCKYGQEDTAFWMEISMLSSLKHKNILSIFGYCHEDDEKIIIYEQAFHGCLNQHLRDPTLTWSRRLQICLGVARALNYIHYDVIHCDINSYKVFLDKDWGPMVFGFELSTKYPQSWRHRLAFSRYTDTSIMTPKHDVYSFGLLLFEVLCGRKPMIGDDGVKEELNEIIDPNLRKQMDTQSLSLFSKTAYNCLNDHLVHRPTMDQIVKELEDMLELQWKHENIEHSTAAEEGALSNRLKIERLKIPLSEIRSATNNFDDMYSVGFGGFGIVYKAILNVLDIQNLSSMKGKCKDELPKKSQTVAIKRIFSRPDEQGKQGFLTEIELLTSCKHPNIVSLLGFSREAREMILVYEYAFNGSLNDCLGNDGRSINLTWAQRIQICLDIAHGINYLHTNMEGKPRIIHRDIKSENILLDDNLIAKVADFGLSKFHPSNQQASTIHTKNIAGTEVYMDPEYLTSFKYKKESDIYSFGVVLFEILSGRVAYDLIYISENDKGLAPIARRRFNEGTLKELIDPKIIEEDNEHIFTLNRGPNQASFDAFSKIAYRCLAETQANRPTMEAVIKALQNTLELQGETMVLSRFRLNDVMLATKNFSKTYCIGFDAYCEVYKAELDDFDNKSSLPIIGENNSESLRTRISVAIKRISGRENRQEKEGFFAEIEMRSRNKHPNIVSLIGFCDEGDEMILVYEHSCNTIVKNMYNLTWTQRLHMSLMIAHGLYHLHTKMDNRQIIIHGDIKSANILLGKNLDTKIAYYGISKSNPTNQEANTVVTDNSVGTKVYRDPEYEKTGKLRKESDIYSFGVVLFEILCGKLAYDPFYIVKNEKGLAAIARLSFDEGTIKEMIDPKLLEETNEDIFASNRGLNEDSLETFSRIAYRCLVETQANRPTMEIVVKELELALNFQENLMSDLQISFKDIESATENFNQKNCVGSGRYWKTYKGELPLANGRTTIVAKRWDSKSGQGDDQFRTELDILFKHKHENIIGLVGYCNERNETVIVYEPTTKGSLKKYIKDANLTWMKRLKICIDVARGLEFLHEGAVTLKSVIHRDIKSSSILLNDDWKAKISNFELSSLDSLHQNMEHVSDNAYGTFGYLAPEYKQGFLTEKSDIYSFGVIMFEILCGRLACEEGVEDKDKSLGSLAKDYCAQGKLDEIVFKGIKEKISPESLTTFADIAHKCLHDDVYMRPEAREVAIHLKYALEFQEDSEIWEPRLPRDFNEIIRLSQTPESYHNEKKKDLYKKLSNGILLQEKNVWFILSENGKANKMISATTFSYENRKSHKRRSIHDSRFQKVAKIQDTSNLNIQVTLNNQFLSPGVVYGVHLVFKFCDSRKLSSRKPMYVNLKYRNRIGNLHSYFATWRDDEWMMIELFRFLNHMKVVDFEFLLKSFSQYYCRNASIYVQGIEFRAIRNVAHEDIKKSKEVQKVQTSNSNMDRGDQQQTNNEEISIRSENDDGDKELFLLKEVNGKKHLMVSANEVLYNSPALKSFRLKHSAKSRFQEVMELLPQQVFRIKYKIEIKRLSPFTEYACFLVFMISDSCHGLHCPIKVQDLLNQKRKETKIIYFRSPESINHHDAFRVPEQRKDGWMEVMVWKFNTKYKLEKNIIPMNLKLITYEGTMSGLIICGFNFRPIVK